jgi:hypothetical protein
LKLVLQGVLACAKIALLPQRGQEMNNTNQQYHAAVMDCPTYSSRAKAPKADLDSKIKAAIDAAVDDGLIYVTGSRDYAFSIDGEVQFYNQLVSLCTATEKADLLHEWILTGDQARAVEVVNYLMADFNPVKFIARDSATRIINHCLFSQSVTEALAARGLPF